jgi:hypothetical protein
VAGHFTKRARPLHRPRKRRTELSEESNWCNDGHIRRSRRRSNVCLSLLSVTAGRPAPGRPFGTLRAAVDGRVALPMADRSRGRFGRSLACAPRSDFVDARLRS